MSEKSKNERALEISLLIVTVGLTCLLYQIAGYKMIVLNLFYLPVVLAAFYLGRYRAGVLALFSVIMATIVTAVDMGNFAAYTSPIAIGLSITVWGGALGLTTLLVGTLSDERSSKIVELNEAYVGVVEVLSRYLQSSDARLKDRSKRVSELSHTVAGQMKLSHQEIDDIRVAALLQDMENVEITAKVIRKAVGDLGSESRHSDDAHTFHGTDFLNSLSSVLTGALPLLLTRPDSLDLGTSLDGDSPATDIPFGAKIISTVRAYDDLMNGAKASVMTAQQALEQLRNDVAAEHHPAVLHALEQVVSPQTTQSTTVIAEKPGSEQEVAELAEV